MYFAEVPGIEPRTGAIAAPEPACAKTRPARRISTRDDLVEQQRLQRRAGGGRVVAVDRGGEGVELRTRCTAWAASPPVAASW